MATRGRPPSASGALTAAERKAAQRERDRAALWVPGAPLDELTLSALVESLPRLIADEAPGTLGAVLVEIGRRGGVSVTVKPYALAPSKRVKVKK